MSSVVSRYGNKNLTTALMRSTPRIVVLAGVGAIAAEWAGSGFIDFVWGSLNRGVRTNFIAVEGCNWRTKFSRRTHIHT